MATSDESGSENAIFLREAYVPEGSEDVFTKFPSLPVLPIIMLPVVLNSNALTSVCRACRVACVECAMFAMCGFCVSVSLASSVFVAARWFACMCACPYIDLRN